MGYNCSKLDSKSVMIPRNNSTSHNGRDSVWKQDTWNPFAKTPISKMAPIANRHMIITGLTQEIFMTIYYAHDIVLGPREIVKKQTKFPDLMEIVF